METLATENQNILAVGAHPDDVEFLIAGTLALLHQKGYRINIATVATGDMGSMEFNTQEISSKRYQEATNAAQILDAPYHTLGESDLHVLFDNPTRFKATELVRKTDPYIVFTLSPQDYMKDHELTVDLIWDACFNASVPNYVTHQANPAPPTTRTPYLFYADPIEGIDRFGQRISPALYVNISSVMETKEQMLAQHDSQRSWLQAQHGMDQYIISMKEWSAKRGREIGVEYAEGFRQHRGHPFPADNILANILGGLCLSQM